MRRPIALWVLVFSLVFLAVGGLFGGMTILTDLTGSSLGMAEVLPLLPVPNYTLPGLFLLLMMGLLPIFLVWTLLARPDLPWLNRLPQWSGYHWAWTASFAIGLVLVIWLFAQGMLIGFKWPIQYVTAINALFILSSVLLPRVRQFYHMQ